MGRSGIELYKLTFKELALSILGYKKKIARAVEEKLYMMRHVCATILNSSTKFTKNIKPSDLFKLPSEMREKESENPIKTKENQKEWLESAMKVHNRHNKLG